MNGYLEVLGGTGLTFFATSLGAAMVFLFRKEPKISISQLFLGFASGIMIAASVWSLIMPCLDMAAEQGWIAWIPAAGGFALGGVFLWGLDRLLPHEHSIPDGKEGLPSRLGHCAMLFIAVTLHNIPEGMAVGLSFAVAAKAGGISYAAAYALATGVALQNFPEGAAISLPLRQEGMSCRKAWLYGVASGAVEPVAGILTVLLVDLIQPLLPWLLSFAAGAMIFVVAEELIPEAHRGRSDDTAVCANTGAHLATMGVMIGFLIMMVMDVALQ